MRVCGPLGFDAVTAAFRAAGRKVRPVCRSKAAQAVSTSMPKPGRAPQSLPVSVRLRLCRRRPLAEAMDLPSAPVTSCACPAACVHAWLWHRRRNSAGRAVLHYDSRLPLRAAPRSAAAFGTRHMLGRAVISSCRRVGLTDSMPHAALVALPFSASPLPRAALRTAPQTTHLQTRGRLAASARPRRAPGRHPRSSTAARSMPGTEQGPAAAGQI